VVTHFERIIPDAYHGTTFISATKILRDGKFQPSTDVDNEDHWLGDGAYFFESEERLAKKQGRKAARKNNLVDKKIGVIRATINLGRCLNLNTIAHAEAVLAAMKHLKRAGKTEVTDAAAINAVAVLMNADVVKASFVWHTFGRISNRLFVANPVFICVRNQENILEMTLSYKGY
jgi:hypothetical protein